MSNNLTISFSLYTLALKCFFFFSNEGYLSISSLFLNRIKTGNLTTKPVRDILYLLASCGKLSTSTLAKFKAGVEYLSEIVAHNSSV